MESNIKAHVRDLRCISGNLFSKLHYETRANEVYWPVTSHLQMSCKDGIKRTRHKEVYLLSIGLMHVAYLMYFCGLLLFVTYVLLL